MKQLTPTQLRDAMGISLSYASMLLNGRRPISPEFALRVFDALGERIGPLAEATDADIAALRRIYPDAVHADASTPGESGPSAPNGGTDIRSDSDQSPEADSHRPFCATSSRTEPSAGSSPDRRPCSTGPAGSEAEAA